MPNPWFAEPADFVPATTARAEDMNALKDAIAAAFDALALNSLYGRFDKGNINGAVVVDLAQGSYQYMTVTGAVTSFDFSNETAGAFAQAVFLEITNGGAFAFAWSAPVKWAGGSAPTLTAAGKDLITLVTRDQGATWHGMVCSLDSK